MVLFILLCACPASDTEPINEGRCRDAFEVVNDSATGGALITQDDGFLSYLEENADSSPSGGWVVGGDLLFENTESLYEYYRGGEPYYDDRSSLDGETFRSTAWCLNDFDRIWDIERRFRLTYCYGDFSTGALSEEVKSLIPIALADVERVADLNFVEVEAGASDCTSLWEANDVEYIIREAIECSAGDSAVDCDCGAEGLFECKFRGLAFGPGSGGGRKIIFRKKLLESYKNNSQAGAAGTVLHEIGHTVGLEHEHRRWIQDSVTESNSNLCKPTPADSPWRAVSPADPDSIMGYPDCDEINDRDEAILSAGDRLGLFYLYSSPRTESIHFDEGSSDDILWVDPRGTNLKVWFGGSDNDGNVSIVEKSFSPVPFPGRVSRRVKPVPVRLTAGPLTSVLLHAPGTASVDPGQVMWTQPEILLRPTPGEPDPFESVPLMSGMSIAEMPERYSVPIAANLFGSSSDEVWWWLPGPDGVRGDLAWQIDVDDETVFPSSAYDATFSPDNYFRPLVGNWASVNAGSSGVKNSQVLWWSDRSGSAKFRLMTQNVQMSGPSGDQQELGACASNLLPESAQYSPFVGSFDDDDDLEILWVAGRGSEHVIWWDVEQVLNNVCSSVTVSQLALEVTPFVKPFVGDFNGDGVSDVFWYEGGAGAGFLERVWYFRNDSTRTFDSRSLVVEGDRTPYVADLNGDGCEDILWFSPHESTSPIWQGGCGPVASLAPLFSVRPPLNHPADMYPLGYSRSRARR